MTSSRRPVLRLGIPMCLLGMMFVISLLLFSYATLFDIVLVAALSAVAMVYFRSFRTWRAALTMAAAAAPLFWLAMLALSTSPLYDALLVVVRGSAVAILLFAGLSLAASRLRPNWLMNLTQLSLIPVTWVFIGF